ncbi:hypothetical protein EIO60_01598|nr:hypothetical protein [Candidatus Pantoea persica]
MLTHIGSEEPHWMRPTAHLFFLRKEGRRGEISDGEKTLEDGAALYLRRADADSLGCNDMGLKNWISRHRLGVLVMVVLALELFLYLMTAS